MKIVDGIILSGDNGEYLEEIIKSMPEENNKPVTESEAINYVLTTFQIIEKMLAIRNIHDPVDFITGLSEGTILIVER
jgi:hypothetical protein